MLSEEFFPYHTSKAGRGFVPVSEEEEESGVRAGNPEAPHCRGMEIPKLAQELVRGMSSAALLMAVRERLDLAIKKAIL